MGGLYWTCNLFIGHIASFIAVYIYTAHSTAVISASYLWTLAVCLECSFVLFFVIFLRTINRPYISTFFTTATGPQYACDNYHLATTDEVRFEIFDHHESFYASIRQELKVWLAENWRRWTVEENPEWFTPRLLASIPEDLLPTSATEETRELRRKSIAGLLEGSEGPGAQIRESVRRHSLMLGGGERPGAQIRESVRRHSLL